MRKKSFACHFKQRFFIFYEAVDTAPPPPSAMPDMWSRAALFVKVVFSMTGIIAFIWRLLHG